MDRTLVLVLTLQKLLLQKRRMSFVWSLLCWAAGAILVFLLSRVISYRELYDFSFMTKKWRTWGPSEKGLCSLYFLAFRVTELTGWYFKKKGSSPNEGMECLSFFSEISDYLWTWWPRHWCLVCFSESYDAVLFCVPDYSNSRVVRPELQTATSLPALIIFNAFDDTAESIFFPVLNPFFPATSKFLFIRATVGLK